MIRRKKKSLTRFQKIYLYLLNWGKIVLLVRQEWEPMTYSHITLIANASTSLYPALSNKTIFKFMDIAEMI